MRNNKNIKIHSFDSWSLNTENFHGSGRSEKNWLVHNDKSGIFKYPKSQYTTEHISEYLASQIAKRLGIRCAKTVIGSNNGRYGSFSYRINKNNEELIEGISFITSKYPKYIDDTLFDCDSEEYYSFKMIESSINNRIEIDSIINMMVFDFLIGNTDRHHSNWAIISKNTRFFEKNHTKYIFSPLYDNGSSLCCYETEERVLKLLSEAKNKGTVLDYTNLKPINMFHAFVISKSRSRIRIDGKSKKEPTHTEVVQFLYNNYPKKVKRIARLIKKRITDKFLSKLLDSIPCKLISDNRKALIKLFVLSKKEVLEKIVKAERGE